MNARYLLFYCFSLITSFSIDAQDGNHKSHPFDDSTTMKIYYGNRYKDSFDPIQFRELVNNRFIELDSLTRENCELILSIFEEPDKIDSLKIERKYASFECTSVLHHTAYNALLLYTTITKENTVTHFEYLFSPYRRKLKHVFVDNEIRSIELYNANNEKEGEQIHFSHNNLDSAYYLVDGKKFEFEYSYQDNTEKALYHGDTVRVLTDNNSDRDLMIHDRSYYWLYPRLKEYNISIPDSSMLTIFRLREQLDEGLEKDQHK